jgi:hypothetical protein
VKWKRFFLDNLGTKLMAFVLAVLLWIYLYNESTESDKFDVSVQPKIEETEIASCQLLDEFGNPLSLRLEVTGPKGQLRGLSRKGIRCEPRFEKGLFTEPTGTFSRELTIDDLNLPEGYKVNFKPSPKIMVRYVKYTIAKLPALPPEIVNQPNPSYRVKAVKITSPPGPRHEVQVRLPADMEKGLKSIQLQPVSVQGISEDLVVLGEIAPDPRITLRTQVTVQVELELKSEPRRFTLPLNLSGPPEVTGRLELVTKTILVEVTGPKDDVDAITDRQLYAYVIVEIPTPAPKDAKYPQSKLYCRVLDENRRDKLTVVVLPDTKPEDRQVEVKVVKD